MTVKEHRMRGHMHKEGEAVLVNTATGAEERRYVPGTVHTVGWENGTYRIRVGRRLHHVSMTQVRAT
jgi:hypothetical protein